MHVEQLTEGDSLMIRVVVFVVSDIYLGWIFGYSKNRIKHSFGRIEGHLREIAGGLIWSGELIFFP